MNALDPRRPRPDGPIVPDLTAKPGTSICLLEAHGREAFEALVPWIDLNADRFECSDPQEWFRIVRPEHNGAKGVVAHEFDVSPAYHEPPGILDRFAGHRRSRLD